MDTAILNTILSYEDNAHNILMVMVMVLSAALVMHAVYRIPVLLSRYHNILATFAQLYHKC